MELKTATLDGKQVAYNSTTQFHIQIGRGKSKYNNKLTIVGDLGRAVMYYNALNIGYGYKKRLLVPSFNKPVLVRAAS